MIHKPVADTVTVYLDGEPTRQLNVDYCSGKFTLNSPPAAGVVITADFEFDIPVRFDTDRLQTVLESYGCYSWQDLPVVEIRL